MHGALPGPSWPMATAKCQWRRNRSTSAMVKSWTVVMAYPCPSAQDRYSRRCGSRLRIGAGIGAVKDSTIQRRAGETGIGKLRRNRPTTRSLGLPSGRGRGNRLAARRVPPSTCGASVPAASRAPRASSADITLGTLPAAQRHQDGQTATLPRQAQPLRNQSAPLGQIPGVEQGPGNVGERRLATARIPT